MLCLLKLADFFQILDVVLLDLVTRWYDRSRLIGLWRSECSPMFLLLAAGQDERSRGYWNLTDCSAPDKLHSRPPTDITDVTEEEQKWNYFGLDHFHSQLSLSFLSSIPDKLIQLLVNPVTVTVAWLACVTSS